MDFFVKNESVVRKIWGNSDTILFIFAGAAAEFALNKAVDWLYFTGKLPADPLGRLFSTVDYARLIVFSEREKAERVIDKMADIHTAVEQKRGARIPDWAFRDVLYMLIDYSMRSYELLEKKMTEGEKQEVFDVFYRVGARMGLKDLPQNYNDWLIDRQLHLNKNLCKSNYSNDLFIQYKKHLGYLRYQALLQAQIMVIPDEVRDMLGFSRLTFLKPALAAYKVLNRHNLDWIIKNLLLPKKYISQIKGLDTV